MSANDRFFAAVDVAHFECVIQSAAPDVNGVLKGAVQHWHSVDKPDSHCVVDDVV